MITFLFDHHNNVLIVVFYTCRSAQLNMNERQRLLEQECIKCLILKMRMRLLTICFPHSVPKGQKTYATQKLNSPLRSGHPRNPISPGGGADSTRPWETFLNNSKTAQDIKMKFSKFNPTLMGVILHIMTILINLRCYHGNLLL